MTEERVSYPTLPHVAMEARPYPSHLLEGCETGLVLFAAAFLGHNDAIWFAEAGMRTTCVDVDSDRLAQMEALYPSDWRFLTADAWAFAQSFRDGALEGEQVTTCDALSVDTFTGDLMLRSLASLDLWCSLARKLVTATITREHFGSYETPEGWEASVYHRANDVYWLVLTRA